MDFPQFDILAISSALLLVTTFGVVVRRGFLDWLVAYRYQAIALSAVTAIIAYVTGIWEIYIAAALTLAIKAIIIPKVLTFVTQKIKLDVKTEENPYVSIRMSVLISAILVALSYFLVQEITIKSDAVVAAYLPLSISLFLIGLFIMVVRRMALNQVVGLLIIENGLFLFTTALTHGTPLIIEIGIFVDIFVGVIISAILLVRMSHTFDTLDVGKLESLKDG